MDLNTLRSLITVITFAMFMGLLAWTLSRRRRADFDEAAHLPFDTTADAELAQTEKMG